MTLQNNLTVQAVEATAREESVDPPANKRGLRPGRVLLHLFLTIASILMALPFVWMLLSSFKPLDEIFIKPPKMLPMAWTTQNYQTAFATGNFYPAFFNSFYIATIITVVSLLTCAMAAYAFARMRFPGNNVLFAIFLATMMVPVQMGIIPLYMVMVKLHWTGQLQAVIVPFLVRTSTRNKSS